MTIHAHKFSKSAVEKIEKAGGKAVLAGGEAARQRLKRYGFPPCRKNKDAASVGHLGFVVSRISSAAADEIRGIRHPAWVSWDTAGESRVG